MKTIVVLLLLSATGFAQSAYEREAEAGARTLERMQRERAATNERNAQAAQEAKAAESVQVDLEQKALSDAIGAKEYVQIQSPMQVRAGEETLDIYPGDCFPITRRDNFLVEFSALGPRTVKADSVRVVVADQTAMKFYQEATSRMIKSYINLVATERAAVWAQRDRAAAATIPKERIPTQRNGQPLPPNWIDPDEADKRAEEARIRGMKDRLNRLQAEKIMRQLNGQP